MKSSVNIAILTSSDSRSLEEGTSSQALVELMPRLNES